MKQLSLRTRYALMLFLILLTTYTYILPKRNWNSASRIALTRAIVEEGVFYIDSYHEVTGDKAFVDGHYYTDKSIGPSMLAVIPHFVYYRLTRIPLFSSLYHEKLILIITTWFSSSLPSALLGAVFFLFTAKFTRKLWYAGLMTLAYGLGTIALPFSIAIFQHHLVAMILFVTFYLLWQIVFEDADKRWFWLIGILVGLAGLSDYLAPVMMCFILLWALYKTRSIKWIVPIIIGTLPFLLLLLFYNTVSFGSPFSIGYSHTEWDAVQGQGFFGLTTPTMAGMWGITFSPFRGLFFISPYLLLSFHGLFIMWKERFDRSAWLLFCFFIAITFIYNSANVMWWGGGSVGPRHFIPALPFLAFPVIFSFNRLIRNRWTRIAVALLLVLSVVNVWAQTLSTNRMMPDTLKQPPGGVQAGAWILEQYKAGDLLDNPLFEYAIPNLQQGNINNTIGTLILGANNIVTLFVPLFMIWGFIWLLFKKWTPDADDGM